MCDTRTWVFKLFIVFLIIHNLRIQQCRAASVSGPVEAVDGALADAGASTEDGDSSEATPSQEDTLPGSLRSTLNSTSFNSRRSNSENDGTRSSLGSSLTGGSIANRLMGDDGAADGYEAPNFDGDDDKSEEGFNRQQRKFNDAVEWERDGAGESDSAPVYGVLKRVEDDDDYKEDGLSTVTPSSTVSTAVTIPTRWNGGILDENNGDDDDDDDDEDVDQILQPLPTDTRHYNALGDGRAMRAGQSYSTENRANSNDDGDKKSKPNEFKESFVTNRMKPAYTSAFEQHKAHIRNSKRYGHKSHKKKYKDFLHYKGPTRSPLTVTTMLTPLQKGVLARDKIYTSDDIPRYYQGQVNYFISNDDYSSERKDPRNVGNHHKHHHQHHNSGHLRSGGRYRHIGVQPKIQLPYNPIYPESNIMNYNQLNSLAKQQHQLELQRRLNEKAIMDYSQQYYKYPHLTELEDKVLQVEQADMMYSKGEFGRPGEIILAPDDSDGDFDKEEEDPNVPPYIRKYRRRNKQLLELLEGTQPPSTPSPPSQWSTSVLKPGPIDGSSHHKSSPQRHHLRSHRKHHPNQQHRSHQRSHRHKSPKWQIEDLFEEQRANPNNPNRTTTTDSEMILPVPAIILGSSSSSTTSTTTTTTTLKPSTSTLSPFDQLLKHDSEHLALLQNNQLPAEDVSISGELFDWAIEVGGDDDNDDSIEHNHSGLNTWNQKPSMTSTTVRPAVSVRRPHVYGSIIKSPASSAVTSTAKPITSFAYHRVVEAPRVVGAGQTGRKQRLPFVAITDRRLETSKKGALNAGPFARKDSEQNHFPMP